MMYPKMCHYFLVVKDTMEGRVFISTLARREYCCPCGQPTVGRPTRNLLAFSSIADDFHFFFSYIYLNLKCSQICLVNLKIFFTWFSKNVHILFLRNVSVTFKEMV